MVIKKGKEELLKFVKFSDIHHKGSHNTKTMCSFHSLARPFGGRSRGRRKQRPRRRPLCFLLNAGRRVRTLASSLSRSPPPQAATPSPSTARTAPPRKSARGGFCGGRSEQAGAKRLARDDCRAVDPNGGRWKLLVSPPTRCG